MVITSYREWYEHPDNDPYNGSYGDLFKMFESEVPTREPADLLNAVATDTDMHLAFVQLDPLGEVRVLHRVRRLTPQTGVPDSQDNLDVAQVGDLTPSGVPYFAEFPFTAFHRTALLDRIPTPEAIAMLLDNHPNASQVAPPDPAPGGIFEAVRTRLYMLIPPIVVAEVLHAAAAPEGLNPRDLWVNIALTLYQDDAYQADCAPFIDWCRVAFAGGVKDKNPVRSPEPLAVRLQRRLDRERHLILRNDLPGRFTPAPQPPIAEANIMTPGVALPPPPSPATDAIVDVLTNIHADYVARADAANAREEARRERPPTVTTPLMRWDEGLPRLLTMCVADDEDSLPPLWKSMARQGLKLDRRTIQTQLNVPDDRYGPSGHTLPDIHVSIALAADLGMLRFVAEKADLIEVGLSIFMVSYPTIDSVACLRKSVDLFDRQMDSAQALTLDEADRLRTSQKPELPTSYFAVRQVCRVYHRLLAITLGFPHPVTTQFAPFVKCLETDEPFFTEYLGRNVERCAGVLRHIQIVVHYCLETVQRNVADATNPDFMCIVMEMKRNCWTPPDIPGVTKSHALPIQGSPNPPAAGQSPTYIHAPPGHIDRTAVPVRADFNPTLCIKTKGSPPTNDKGHPMCLRYQVIGYCVAGCPRGSDHKKHNAAENTRLAAYLAKAKP